MSVKLLAGKLSTDTSGDDFPNLFSEAGVVESGQVITDRETGRAPGVAFIEMNSLETADTAKEKLI